MQVYVGNRRVGEASVSPRRGSDYVKIPVQVALDLDNEVPDGINLRGATIKTITLPIGPMCLEICDRELMPYTVEELLSRHGVKAEDCRVMTRPDTCTTIFSFDVLRISPDQFEEIFDFDWFQPV